MSVPFADHSSIARVESFSGTSRCSARCKADSPKVSLSAGVGALSGEAVVLTECAAAARTAGDCATSRSNFARVAIDVAESEASSCPTIWSRAPAVASLAARTSRYASPTAVASVATRTATTIKGSLRSRDILRIDTSRCQMELRASRGGMPSREAGDPVRRTAATCTSCKPRLKIARFAG